VRRHRRPGLAARAPLEQRGEALERAPAARHLHHRAHERAVHLAQEAVRLDPELEQGAALFQRAARTLRSKRTCSVSVGVKAVKRCLPTSACAQL